MMSVEAEKTSIPHYFIKEVRLNCGHVMRFRETDVPLPGFLVLCTKCDDYKHRPFPLKTGANGMPVLREWEWKCISGNRCNCGNHKFGLDPRGAYAAARKHSVNNAGHEVWVISPIGCVRDRWAVGTALFEVDEEVFKDAG